MLMQGPPGTGKTATIIGALTVLVARQVRTLVCSSSNHAVDDIARKIANKGLIGETGTFIRPFGIFYCCYQALMLLQLFWSEMMKI